MLKVLDVLGHGYLKDTFKPLPYSLRDCHSECRS